MALFKVNTGCREAEVTGLRWDWEVEVPELETSVFVVPGERVKNAEDRVVVLNSVARRIVEDCRGQHSERVFTWKGRPVGKMNSSAWKRARVRADLPTLRVHDLKHTFGRRLRSAGISVETRRVLLGHKTGDITTHYSAPELKELIHAAERVCDQDAPGLVILKDVRKFSVSGESG